MTDEPGPERWGPDSETVEQVDVKVKPPDLDNMTTDNLLRTIAEKALGTIQKPLEARLRAVRKKDVQQSNVSLGGNPAFFCSDEEWIYFIDWTVE